MRQLIGGFVVILPLTGFCGFTRSVEDVVIEQIYGTNSVLYAIMLINVHKPAVILSRCSFVLLSLMQLFCFKEKKEKQDEICIFVATSAILGHVFMLESI